MDGFINHWDGFITYLATFGTALTTTKTPQTVVIGGFNVENLI